MKKTNKGFSLVELIIVIAIMAILAGALAPALLKYINKSRLSSDIQTGQTIATAIQAALANDDAYDVAPTCSGVDPTTWMAGGDSFKDEFASAMGKTTIKGKAKKGLDGSTALNQTFYVSLNPAGNEVQVFYGAQSGASYMVYPTPGKLLSK